MRKFGWLFGAMLLMASGAADARRGSASLAAEPAQMVREIYVPFGELHVLLENQPQRVVLGRQEFEDLLRRAERTAAATAPMAAALLSADYTATVDEDRAVWSGVLEIEVLHQGLQAVPLDFSEVGLRQAVLDGKPASLGSGPEGRLLLFVEGQGIHRLELEMVSPVIATAAQRTLGFRLPQAPSGKLRLVVPGDVEIRSGAAVASRQWDGAAGVTRLELLPRPGDMSLVISLNSRLKQQERVVVARSVLVDEITRSAERLHATVSLAVLHRVVNQFQFRLPEGFEITHVASPQLLRWSVSGPPARRVLEVRLREETDKTVVLQLSALRVGPVSGEWSFPRLEPLEVASHSAVLGLLVEDRLEAPMLGRKGLIPIDTAVLARALSASAARPEPGAPPLRFLAAYYAPHTAFELKGRFVLPPADCSVQTNLLLSLEEQELRVQGGFLLVPRGEKLLGFDIAVPEGWEITAVTGADGKGLGYDRSPPAERPGRVHVRLPQGVPPGREARVLFRARSVPKGWLDVWNSREVVFPKFTVQGAVRDVGAIAIAAGQDLAVRASALERLTPLSDSEKDRYGLAGVFANLVYRYETPEYSALLAVERNRPRVSARTFVFARMEADGFYLHGEILYTVEEARAQQLAFSLPETAPEALSIQALDETRLKQWRSQKANGLRRWNVLLEEPRQGTIRLGVDFRQPTAAGRASDAPASFVLPHLQAENVVYQSGLVAVEGNPEVEVRVETPARRVDVGELVDALYQPGRRLLGVFGFAGQPVPVTIHAAPRAGLGLYPAIVQTAQLTTHLSAEGVAQTQAIFQLRTKVTSLEVRLSEGSELWSALVDDTPVKPQIRQGRLLLSLAASPADRLRKLQLVYQTPVPAVGWMGTLDLPAPALALGADGASPAVDIPLADLQWNLRLPRGYYVVRNLGTVASDEDAEPVPLAAIEVLKAVAAAPVAPFLLGGWESASRPLPLEPPARVEAYRLESLKEIFLEPKSAIPGPVPFDRELIDSARDPETSARPTPEAAKTAEERRRYLLDSQAPSAKEERFFDRDSTSRPPPVTPPKAPVPRGAGIPGRYPGARPGEVISEAKAEAPAMPGAAVPPPRKAVRGEPPKSEAPPKPEQRPGPSPAISSVGQKELASAMPDTGLAPATAQKVSPTTPPQRFRSRLEGLSSLRIALTSPAGDSPNVVFRSFGADPRLVVRLADQRRFAMVGWVAVAGVLWVGIALTGRSAWSKARWILSIAVAGTGLAILPGVEWLAKPANMAVYAAAALVPYYLLVALVRCGGRLAKRLGRWPVAKRPAERGTVTTTIALAILLNGSVWGQNAEPPPEPVKVPDDVLILPYDPDLLPGAPQTTQVLVPYAKYLELRALAFPDQKSVAKPPAAFGWAGGSYTAVLTGGNFVEITGRLEIDVFVDEAVQVPLGLARAVLTRAELDGKPAPLEVAQPAELPPGVATPRAGVPPAGPILLARLSGRGRHTLDLTLRLNVERRGGWQAVDAVVPSAPATALNLSLAEVPGEVRLAGLPDRPNHEVLRADQPIRTALGPQGTVNIQWRPKVAQSQVDRALTARSMAVLDVEDEGLRLFWQVELEFPRSQRHAFRLRVPAGYLVEAITGGNVRTWQVRREQDGHSTRPNTSGVAKVDQPPAGQKAAGSPPPQAGAAAPEATGLATAGATPSQGKAAGRATSGPAPGQMVEVSLIKPARDREQFVVRLSRPESWGEAGGSVFDAPAVAVPEAALNPGILLVRRSPRLALRSVSERGVVQTDRPAVPAGADGVESPLGLRPFGAWQFSVVSYELRLAVAPRSPSVTAEVHSLMKIAEYDRTLESRITLDIGEAPLYGVELLLPEGLVLDADGVMVPGSASWAVAQGEKRGRLVIYLAQGRTGRLAVVIRGRLKGEARAGRIPLPLLEVLHVSRQEGELAVQADPDYDVIPVELTNCEVALPDRLRRWLKPAQFAAVQRWAIRYHQPDYGGWLMLRLREPAIAATTITNVRFTPSTIEETLLVIFSIEGAGLREVRFLLPATMKDSRIQAPMLRQKTIEPLPASPEGQVRVRLEFQGEQRGDVRVLIENDRGLADKVYRAPIPQIETPTAQVRQYVALQSAGRDEVIVHGASGVEPLGWDQREAEVLRQYLGRVTQGFVVRGQTPHLELALRRREADSFAGARIGLGETLLVLDALGGYRAQQTYQVDNATEPFLEVELPEGARLWTAHVAGEPVKPAAAPSGGDQRARIPLIKTALGDRDYPVVLKYGGQVKPVGIFGQVAFPLVRAVNIRVEQSNVEIYLPESHQWLRFRGTVGPGVGQQELEAERQTYFRKQQQRLLEAARHADDFAKVRALVNLQASLEVALEAKLKQETREELRRQEQGLAAQSELDNRPRLGKAYAQQKPARSKNVILDLGQNWDQPESAGPTPGDKKDALRFNVGWLAANSLESARPAGPEATAAGKRLIASEARDEPARLERKSGLFVGPGVGQSPGGGQGSEKFASPPSGAPATSQKGDVVFRYQQRLAEQQVQSPDADKLSQGEKSPPPAAADGGLALPGPAQTPSTPPTATGLATSTGLASIDVDVVRRGRVVHFTAPGGELALSAWGVSNRWLADLARLGLVAVVVGAAAATGKALARRRRPRASPVEG